MAELTEAQQKIIKKIQAKLHDTGYCQFTIATSRFEWFTKLIEHSGMFYSSIAESTAWLEEKKPDHKQVIKEASSNVLHAVADFFIDFFREDVPEESEEETEATEPEPEKPKKWVMVGVGVSDLVKEDFRPVLEGNSPAINTTTFAVAPSQGTLRALLRKI
jgi:hypothetical protein